MKNNSKETFLAFTLAEVLITLGVIGVVAAITIPTLLNSTQDKELKSAWKKEYAQLSNTYNTIINENGGKLSGLGLNNITFADLFKSYYSVMEEYSGGGQIKLSDGSQYFVTEIKTLNGNIGYGALGLQGGTRTLILKNGTFLIFEYTGGDASNTWDFNGADWITTITASNHIFVDVNGVKKPNTLGKDVFGVFIYKNNLIPFGKILPGVIVPTPGGALQNTCTTSTRGHGCSFEYLIN